MSKLKTGNVYIEISHNQAGGLSLCVSNDDGGCRISGDKVGGCETLKCFEVNAEELIAQIREHAKRPPQSLSVSTKSLFRQVLTQTGLMLTCRDITTLKRGGLSSRMQTDVI